MSIVDTVLVRNSIRWVRFKRILIGNLNLSASFSWQYFLHAETLSQLVDSAVVSADSSMYPLRKNDCKVACTRSPSDEP